MQASTISDNRPRQSIALFGTDCAALVWLRGATARTVFALYCKNALPNAVTWPVLRRLCPGMRGLYWGGHGVALLV